MMNEQEQHVTEETPSVTEELNGLMMGYIGVLAQQRELKKKKDDIKTAILIFLKINDIDRYESPDNIILTNKTVTRRIINKAAVVDYCEKNNLDFSAFEKESVTERLSIKKMEVKEDVDNSNVESV